MSELPEAHRAAVRWLRWAREDLALGEHGFRNEALAPRGACVWAHQAGEKAIKALLVAHDVDPPKRHDLDRLVRLLPSSEAERFAVLDLPELSRWAIDGRYPDDFDEATRQQASVALNLARAILAAAAARVDEIINSDDTRPQTPS